MGYVWARVCKMDDESVEIWETSMLETALVDMRCVTCGCRKLGTPASRCLDASKKVLIIDIQDSRMGI